MNVQASVLYCANLRGGKRRGGERGWGGGGAAGHERACRCTRLHELPPGMVRMQHAYLQTSCLESLITWGGGGGAS